MSETTNSPQLRIRTRKYKDGYYYIWRNGKRELHTAYGDSTAARRAADELRNQALKNTYSSPITKVQQQPAEPRQEGEHGT